MIKFILIILLALPTYAQDTVYHDPNEPLPDGPVKINLPHSSRTKDNLGEAFADFLLTKGFQSITWADISYDFFEIEDKLTLKFTNFKIDFRKHEISEVTSGTMLFGTLRIDFKQLLTYFKTKEPTIGDLRIEKFSTQNLKIQNHPHPYTFSADKIRIINSKSVNTSRTNDFLAPSSIMRLEIEEADIENGKVLFNKKKYRAKNLILKKFSLEQDRQPSLIDAEEILLNGTPVASFKELQEKTLLGKK